MCNDHLLSAAVLLVAGVAAIALLWRLDEWRETSRRRRLMADALERYEQSQHTWRESPVVDVERRG